MKKIFTCLCTVLLYFGCLLPGRAVGLLGGEIEYMAVTPGVYIATFTGYYDCNGSTFPTSVKLHLTSPGCAAKQTFIANIAPGGATYFAPYCPAVGNTCTSTSLPNVRSIRYTATITLNQNNCTDWVISYRECFRPPVANIQNSANPCLYVESAMHPVAGGMDTPQLWPATTYFAILNEPTNINLSAEDYSGDSLAYSLTAVLDTFNVSLPYAAGFSATNPLPTSTGIRIKQQTGTLTFTPNHFNPATSAGANAYLVGVKVAGYRNVNGVVTKVSEVQRNLTIFVVNNGLNKNPQLINAKANNQPVLPDTIIPVPVGGNLKLQFGTADANAGDSLTIILLNSMFSPYFTIHNGTRPTATLTMPLPRYAGNFIYLPFEVRDNGCPVQGSSTHFFVFKTVAGLTGMQESSPARAQFQVYPNPFTEEVTFKFDSNTKGEILLIQDLTGRLIDRIAVNKLAEGKQVVKWENAGNHKAGIYLARLVSADQTVQTLKFTKLQ